MREKAPRGGPSARPSQSRSDQSHASTVKASASAASPIQTGRRDACAAAVAESSAWKAARSVCASAPVGWRSAGTFASIRATTRSRLTGTSGRSRESGRGCSRSRACSTAVSSARSGKGRSPASIS